MLVDAKRLLAHSLIRKPHAIALKQTHVHAYKPYYMQLSGIAGKC